MNRFVCVAEIPIDSNLIIKLNKEFFTYHYTIMMV